MGSIANLTAYIEPAKSWPGEPGKAGADTQDWEKEYEDGVYRIPHYLPPELPPGKEHFPGVRMFRAVSAWCEQRADRVLLVLHRGGPGDCDTIAAIADSAVLTEQVTQALDYVHGRRVDWAAEVAAARRKRDRYLAQTVPTPSRSVGPEA